MPEAAAWPDGRRITISDLRAATDRGERWSMLTSYDTTVPITMDQLVPMVQAVVRGTRTTLVVADLSWSGRIWPT